MISPGDLFGAVEFVSGDKEEINILSKLWQPKNNPIRKNPVVSTQQLIREISLLTQPS